jgi:hypothetical protein
MTPMSQSLIKTDEFHTMSDILLSKISKWFSANEFALDFDKTNIIIFITTNSPQHTLRISYKERYMEESKYKVPWSTD